MNYNKYSTNCQIHKEKECPVASTCGIYIGLEITQDKNGNIVKCNRYDYFTLGEGVINE